MRWDRWDRSPAWWRQLGGAFQSVASLVHAKFEMRCVVDVVHCVAREGHAAPALGQYVERDAAACVWGPAAKAKFRGLRAEHSEWFTSLILPSTRDRRALSRSRVWPCTRLHGDFSSHQEDMSRLT